MAGLHSDELARRIARTTDVNAIVFAHRGVSEVVEEARSKRAELIVANPDEHPLRALVRGASVGRVIRKSRLPVLVVRSPPTESYRRPLIALDLEELEVQVLTFSLRLLSTPLPTVAIVHAYDVPFESYAYPDSSNETAIAYREQHRLRAKVGLDQVLARVGTPLGSSEQVRWECHLVQGSPRGVIATKAADLRADLLVLGTHARTGLAHALIGSVAADVLRAVDCDVLVVPLIGR